MNSEQKYEPHHHSIPPEQMQRIIEIANSIRYGSIILSFQDGVLVQIEKSEKIRIIHSE